MACNMDKADLEAAFKALDADGSGQLCAKDLEKVLGNAAKDVPEDKLKAFCAVSPFLSSLYILH